MLRAAAGPHLSIFLLLLTIPFLLLGLNSDDGTEQIPPGRPAVQEHARRRQASPFLL